MEQITLSGAKRHDNPRTITQDQYNDLQQNIKELGDLSGVLYDENSGEFPGGNQRSEIFKNCQVEIVERFDPPTATGTTALGFILYNGEKHNYRQVRWTEEQCRRAVITANSMGGKWDIDKLANEWSDLPLVNWGVDLPKHWLEATKEHQQEKTVTYTEKFEVVVECSNEADQQKVYDKLKELGYSCRVLQL